MSRRALVVGSLLLALACRTDRTVLTLANWADYRESEVEDRALAPFETAHPGVVVQQQSAGTGLMEYRERVLTAIAAGHPPDLMQLDQTDVPAFTDHGAVVDLAPYLARLGIDPARYDSTVLGIFRRGSAVYALPTGYTPMVIVYNKDLFDRAALPYPTSDWTWDEFRRVACVLTRDTDGDGRVDQWGTAFDRRAFLWMPWLWSGGGDVLCGDGARATGCLDSPQSVTAIRWLTGWVTDDSIAPRAEDNLRLFYSGRIAMLTAGHFWLPTLRPYVDDGRLRIGFVEIPHRQGAQPETVVYASGLAVPTDAAHRKLSVELAAFLADSLAEAIRLTAGVELPSLTAAAQTVAILDTTGWEPVFVRAMHHARPPWGARVARWREIEAALPEMMDRIVLQHVDAAAAAHDVARQVDSVLTAADP
jgi:multiple sugar transport system substrate-binding protein